MSHLVHAERTAVAVVLGAVALAAAHPAQAQLSGSLTLASDDRLRGHSLVSGRPVAAATVGYDAPSGAYVDGGASVAPTQGVLALIGGSIDAGYAWRTASALVIDVGATRQQFTRYFSGGRVTGYSELYAGVSGRSLSARLSYSPDYFATGVHTLYGSLDGVIRVEAGWRLIAHAGSIAYLSPMRISKPRPFAYDVAVGAGHRSGQLDLRLDLSFNGPDADYYGGRRHHRTSLAASAATFF